MPAYPVAREKLDALGVDWVCDLIGDKRSLTSIAEEAKVSIGSLFTWIGMDADRSARVTESRSVMARYWDELAEKVIQDAADEFELRKAKDLAHHYRWRATKIRPAEYGDRQTIAGDPESPLLGVSDDQLDSRLNELLKKAQV